MKVFISWSKARSKELASALREILRNAFHPAVQPWMSEKEIGAGRRWTSELAAGLLDAQVGIICVTKENEPEPWLNFEAGAIAKTVERDTFVCPYLLDQRPGDLGALLGQFQAVQADHAGTLKLFRDINVALGDQGRPELELTRVFEKWWPDLDAAIRSIPPVQQAVPEERTEREMLEELLVITRDLYAAEGASLESARGRVERLKQKLRPQGFDFDRPLSREEDRRERSTTDRVLRQLLELLAL